jgi:hypothetical protein
VGITIHTYTRVTLGLSQVGRKRPYLEKGVCFELINST